MAKDYLTAYMKTRAGLETNRQAEQCYEAILEEIGVALASGEKVVKLREQLNWFEAFDPQLDETDIP